MMDKHRCTQTERPRVAVIGAGFAGLAAARGLAHSPVEVVVIDRNNHHVFQPLLYQVATAALSPAQIAQPVRTILKRQSNCKVDLMEVTGIDTEQRVVQGTNTSMHYDYLVVATGATHTWFNHDEWAPHAPGLKTIEDALRLRRMILNAFEQAELTRDPAERKALMTFVLIGAGPTGVEMAGAIAELARHTLPGEFRSIDPAGARVILVEADSRVLPAFPESLSTRARQDLEQLGVEVMTGQQVTSCSGQGVTIDDRFTPCHSIIWCAGVKASPAANWLGAEHDRAGRVCVNPDLSIPGHDGVFVVGDTAHIIDSAGITVPGLCPAAIQQGSYVARVIDQRVCGRPVPPPFRYHNRGIMATIGRGKAVADIGRLRFTGLFAWLLWGIIHLLPLVGFRNRLVVALDWFWSYISASRGVRLITDIHTGKE